MRIPTSGVSKLPSFNLIFFIAFSFTARCHEFELRLFQEPASPGRLTIPQAPFRVSMKFANIYFATQGWPPVRCTLTTDGIETLVFISMSIFSMEFPKNYQKTFGYNFFLIYHQQSSLNCESLSRYFENIRTNSIGIVDCLGEFLGSPGAYAVLWGFFLCFHIVEKTTICKES